MKFNLKSITLAISLSVMATGAPLLAEDGNGSDQLHLEDGAGDGWVGDYCTLNPTLPDCIASPYYDNYGDYDNYPYYYGGGQYGYGGHHRYFRGGRGFEHHGTGGHGFEHHGSGGHGFEHHGGGGHVGGHHGR